MQSRVDLLAAAGRLALVRESIRAMSHQLAQPLAAIANYAGAATELRRLGRLDEERLGKVLENINRLADRASEVLSGMKKIAERDTTTSRVDVSQTVRYVLSVMEERLRQQRVEVHLQCSDGMPAVVVDPIALQQAIMQMMVIAMDALLEGKGEIIPVLEIRTEPAGHDKILIDVLDKGAPLGGETVRRNLDEPSAESESSGSGIGLLVLRTLVDDLGGKVHLGSESARTRLCIVLPSVYGEAP